MSQLEVDASNACVPYESCLDMSYPPLPSTTRGERCPLDYSSRAGGKICYSFGKLIVVWNLLQEEDGKRSKPLVYRGHTAAVTSLKISPSGCYVASGDSKGKLRVWSLDNEMHLCKLELSHVFVGGILDIAWDGDSKRLLLVGQGDAKGGCVKYIQWDTGVSCTPSKFEFQIHFRYSASSCAIRPVRPIKYVSGGTHDARTLWHSNNPTVDSHTRGTVTCCRYNPTGTCMATVGTDKSLILHDGNGSGQILKKIPNLHNATITSCDWVDAEHILTSSTDGSLKITATEEKDDNTITLIPSQDSLGQQIMACCSIDTETQVAIQLTGTIKRIAKKETQTFIGHQAPISCLCIADKQFYTADSNGNICQWNLQTNQPIQRVFYGEENKDGLYKVHSGAITSLAVIEDTLYSVGWDDVLRSQLVNIPLPAQPNAMAVYQNSILVIVTTDGLLTYSHSTQELSDLLTLPDRTNPITVDCSSTHVYVGDDDGSIHIYTLTTELQHVHTMETVHMRNTPVSALKVSSDGTKLASADLRSVCVWSIPEYKALVNKSRWCFHTQRITCLTWLSNDQYIASAGQDDSIYIWCLAKKSKRLHYPFSHRGGITSLYSIPCENKLLSVGNDACVNQWDPSTDMAKKFS